MDKVKIGLHLKDVLDKKGITPVELESHLGITKGTIDSKLGEGSFFGFKNLFKVADFLDLSIDDILYAGSNKKTRLRQFLERDIQGINLEDLPSQPDRNGKTVLDHLVEIDDIEKFNFYYSKLCFTEQLHSNVKFLSYCIKKGAIELLSNPIISKYPEVDSFLKPINSKSHIANLPVLDFVCEPNKGVLPRERDWYSDLSSEQKAFVDAIFESSNSKILDLMKFTISDSFDQGYPFIFYLALEKDCIFVVDYYIDENIPLDSTLFYYAVDMKAFNVASYLFNRITDEKLRESIVNRNNEAIMSFLRFIE